MHVMKIHLGESSLFFRGFHFSPLQHGSIKPAGQLLITLEDDNPFDLNTDKISNGGGVFVGHVAIEQSCGFRSMLRNSTALDIQVQANFVWTEQEAITMPYLTAYGLASPSQ